MYMAVNCGNLMVNTFLPNREKQYRIPFKSHNKLVDLINF